MSTKLDPIGRLKSLLADGWQNLKTGFGDPRRDKRAHTVPTVDVLSYDDAVLLYRSSDILSKIVDEPSRTAFREGWRVKLNDEDSDKEQGEEIDSEIQAHGGYAKACDVLRYSRAFGGGALFIGADDGQLAEKELKRDQIKTIDFVTALDARECVPVDWYDNASHPKYGQPRFYEVRPRVVGTGVNPDAGSEEKNKLSTGVTLKVHESRIIPMFGSRIERGRGSGDQPGWGESLYQRVWQHVADFDTAISASAILMAEFSQPVFKVRGLAELMASDREDIVKKRIELLNLSRSVIRGVMIDAEGEDYSRVASNMSGLDGVLIQLAQRVAAACDYPASLLFGTSPAGLNATGAADVRFWYDRVKAIQTDQVKPMLSALAEFICLAKDGPTGGELPDDWCMEPNPLWQDPEGEQATRNLTQAQADQIYLDKGVVTPMEIRKSRFGGDRYSLTTQVEDDNEIDTETDDPTLAGEGVTRIDPATGKPMQTGHGMCPACKVEGTIGMPCATCEKPIPAPPAPAPGQPGTPGAVPGAAPLVPATPGAAPATPAGGSTPADTAMNGVQVSSMVEVVTSVVKGLISRESGSAILQRAFLVSPEMAETILGPKDFKPEPDPLEVAKAEALKNPKPMPGQPGKPPAVLPSK